MSNKERTTILLVDDETSARMSACRVLRDEGYTILEAGNYQDAVNAYNEHRDEICLLLTAISLPGNNGYELYKTLLDIEPNLKVLFMSGHAGAEVCRFYGMSTTDAHFLEKPFRAADLLQRVKTLFKSAEPRTGTASA